jgi:uncharacterized Tic20 family protein
MPASDLWALLADLPSARPAPWWVSPVPRTRVRPDSAERGWAALGHLSGLLTSFVGPLLVACTVGRRSEYVRHHALEAAVFQVGFILANILLVPAVVVTLGIAALLFVPLWFGWLIFPWIAAAVATAGEPFRYPLIPRFLRFQH